jgi:hypothetical protein
MFLYKDVANGRAFPDEYDFREWLRVFYNDIEGSAGYKTPKSYAYQVIIGVIIDDHAFPGDPDDDEKITALEEIRRDIEGEYVCADEPWSDAVVEHLVEAVELIEEYQKLAAEAQNER